MDADIQWGDVEEQTPQAYRRPDRNRHFAVAECGALRDGELPIYVDIDVMRNMEAHAQTDTSVELGGVLLGGQYEDDNGQPFVVITDALRAKHYEATKGSFKFTHDTWSEITRERDEFPDELQMIGWYHTHPDWGVFLSGMDTFICENFFNRPLDIALVIDPCRDDRGFFQWNEDSGNRLPRTGGFYLIASRFRQPELDFYAAQLEGKVAMRSQSNMPGYENMLYPAPIVNNMPAQQSPWIAVGVIGMLAVQICLTALIAWRLTEPPVAAPPANGLSKEVVAVLERIERIEHQRNLTARLQGRKELLNEFFEKINVVTDGLPEQIEQLQTDNERLRAGLVGVEALQQRSDALTNELKEANSSKDDAWSSLEKAEVRGDDLKSERDKKEREVARLRGELNEAKVDIDAASKSIAARDDLLEKYAPPDVLKELHAESLTAAEGNGERSPWATYAIIGLAVVAVGIAGAITMLRRGDDATEPTGEEESTEENESK